VFSGADFFECKSIVSFLFCTHLPGIPILCQFYMHTAQHSSLHATWQQTIHTFPFIVSNVMTVFFYSVSKRNVCICSFLWIVTSWDTYPRIHRCIAVSFILELRPLTLQGHKMKSHLTAVQVPNWLSYCAKTSTYTVGFTQPIKPLRQVCDRQNNLYAIWISGTANTGGQLHDPAAWFPRTESILMLTSVNKIHTQKLGS
jgi:hypothetical protein